MMFPKFQSLMLPLIKPPRRTHPAPIRRKTQRAAALNSPKVLLIRRRTRIRRIKRRKRISRPRVIELVKFLVQMETRNEKRDAYSTL